MLSLWVASIGAAGVAALLTTPRPGSVAVAEVPAASSGHTDRSWLARHRAVCSGLAGLGVWVLLGGPAGGVLGVAGGVAAWVVIGRAEPPGARRRREEIAHDLPAVVTLLAAALRSGAAPSDAVSLVVGALPGAAAERLGPVAAHLDLGARPAEVWGDLAHDADLAVLGRTMARAGTTGAPVVVAVERLADDLAARSRAEVEDRARAVGVQAAVPLGLCLLPAFVLIGIVPLVAALLESLAW